MYLIPKKEGILTDFDALGLLFFFFFAQRGRELRGGEATDYYFVLAAFLYVIGHRKRDERKCVIV